MKAQTQALTAVMVTGITMGAVATAYVWGTPVLEKRQSRLDLNNVEKEVMDVRDEILRVGQSGQGTTGKLEINPKNGEIVVNPSENYIEVVTRSSSSPYPENRWTLLKGKATQGLSIDSGDRKYGDSGVHTPVTVAVKPSSGAENKVLKYRIEARNMFSRDFQRGTVERINITSGRKNRAKGSTTLLVSNRGTESDRIELSSGEPIKRENTNIEIRLNAQ